MILATECNMSDRAFNRVGIELDAAIMEAGSLVEHQRIRGVEVAAGDGISGGAPVLRQVEERQLIEAASRWQWPVADDQAAVPGRLRGKELLP